jgi:hypothetical protein
MLARLHFLQLESPLGRGGESAPFKGVLNLSGSMVAAHTIQLLPLLGRLFLLSREMIRICKDDVDGSIRALPRQPDLEFVDRFLELALVIVGLPQSPRPGKGINLHAALLFLEGLLLAVQRGEDVAVNVVRT